MNKGTRVLLCTIAVLLIIIAENGVPVKKIGIIKGIKYVILLVAYISMTDSW